MPPRILIAEDNESFSASLETLLRRKGYETERRGDGVSALRSIAALPPDLLILDLKLPQLHGVELLKKLRQSPRTRELPVIIVTGVFRGEKFAQAARALGVTAYLEKPFKAEQLLSELARLLPAAPAARPTTSPPPSTRSQPATMDRHLHRAFTGRFSGRLLLKGEEEKRLDFLGGVPVSLRPGFVHRDFGDYLRRRGILTEQEYDYYRGSGEYRHSILVQMGCLRYHELLQEKLAYLTEELIESFSHPPLPAEEESFAGLPPLQLVTVNMPHIFHRGFQRHPRPGADRAVLEKFGRQFAGPSEDFFRYVNFLSLGEEEKLLLQSLDGSRTLLDGLEKKEEMIPLVQTLQTLGMLRFASAPFGAPPPTGFPLRTFFNAPTEETLPPAEEALEKFDDLVEQTEEETLIPHAQKSPAAEAGLDNFALAQKVRKTHAGLQGKNYYEIFGMNQGKFSFDLLKERYFALTREFGPETLMVLSGEESTLVEEILSIVTSAYNTLSDVVKKERYDELLGSEKIGLGHKGDDRFQAQVQFQSGKVFLDMEDWESAEKALQDACNITPNNGDYLAHLAWAIYRNPKNASSRAVQDKARQMLNRAITLDRTASGFAFKGWMALEAGQDALAEAEFNKALKLDARQMTARKGLRDIQERREQQKKGLFGKMFR